MKRLLTTVVISLFFYLPYGFALTVEVPEAKGAFPDDFLTYVWAFEAVEPRVLDIEIESLDGWQIQGNVQRTLNILPNTPSFLAVSVQIPKNAFEGSYPESVVLKLAEESYTVTTEVGFVSGLDIQTDASMIYSGDTTLWSVELHNTGNGGDVYTIQVGREQQSRQVNLAAGESIEVFMPIGVGYQAYSIGSMRDETLFREGRVHVQNKPVRRVVSADEPYSLRTQISTEYSTEHNSLVDVRLHGNVSDYVYSDYSLRYSQKNFEDTLELDNVASSLRFEGLEDNWFIEGDVAKEQLEFAGGFSNQDSVVSVSSDLLKLQTQIRAEQLFPEQSLITGISASLDMFDDSSTATNLSMQDVSGNSSSNQNNVLDVNVYASQVFSGASQVDRFNRRSEEELERLNVDGLEYTVSNKNTLEPLASVQSIDKLDSESADNWFDDVNGDWDLNVGVQSQTWQDYDFNIKAQTGIELNEVESRFGLKVDKILTVANVELNSLLNYQDFKSKFQLFPTAELDEDYWRVSLNYQYFNSNNGIQLNDKGDWLVRNSFWWSVLNGFTLKVTNELKTVDDELSFAVDIGSLNLQNAAHRYEALPFMQFSTDKLEDAVVGIDLRARALLGADTALGVYWSPFESSLGANLSSEFYFDATKFNSELRYSDAQGKQQVGAKLNIVHPLLLEQNHSISIVGDIGFNTSLLSEASPLTADQVFSIPELSNSQSANATDSSDWYISVGLNWNDATAVSESIVEFFGGRKSALLSGKVAVIGGDIPENLIVKAGSHELSVDAEGYFSQVVPEGSYTLSIDTNSIPSGFFTGRSEVSVVVGQATAEQNAGQPEVLLTLLAASTVSAKLSLPESDLRYVSTSSKTNFPQVTIDLKNQKGLTLTLRSDARGDFQLDNLRPGVYDVFVHVPDGWQVKQQSFQFSLAAGEAGSFQLELFPKLIEQRSFQPNRVRIRDVVVEAESVPPGSRPLIEVILRGEASQVTVEQGGELLLLEQDSNGIWQGRIDIPKTAKGSTAFEIVATDTAGNETKYPLFVTVEETAPWGVASLPQAVLEEGLVQARVHWYTDNIVESQVRFLDREYFLEGNGADWQTQLKIESGVEQATRFPITFSAQQSDNTTIDIRRVLVVQPK